MVNALSNSSASVQTNYPNFFPAAQNDFAARLKWSVTSRYADANHEPVVHINGPLHVMAYAGQKIKLSGTVKDPDGNKLTTRWWHFQMPDYPGLLQINNANTLIAEVQIPKDAKKGMSFHVILEASDDGVPSITRYQRVIITVGER